MTVEFEVSSKNTIIDSIATILWGMAWADAVEKSGDSSMLVGAKIEEIMAPVPIEAIVEASIIYGAIEQANNTNIYALLKRAANADEKAGRGYSDELFHSPDYKMRFGECLAFMAKGAGVSWFDDHADFDIEVPLCDDQETVFAAENTVENVENAPSP